MKTSNLKCMTRGLLHVAVLLLPVMSLAQQLTDKNIDQELERRTPETLPKSAYERGTQTAPDPWTVSSSSMLFSRPTFDETFKLSVDGTEGDQNYSLSGSPVKLFGPANRFLDGFQTLVSYSTASKQASLAVKWNLSLKDIRFFSQAEKQEVYSAGSADFTSCETAALRIEKESFDAELLKCGMAQRDAQNKVLDQVLEKRKLRPTFSAGVAAAFGFENYRWSKVTGNVSMDLPFSKELSVVLNGDFESSPDEEGVRHPSLGGSLALSYSPPILDNRLRVAFAGKVLECMDNCGPESSTLQFGPSVGVAVDKDSVLGASLNWSGKGASAGDAFFGLSVTRSFGRL